MGCRDGGESRRRERETLEEHWPVVAYWETLGWSSVCSKEEIYTEFYEQFKGLPRVIRLHAMYVSFSDCRP